MKFGDQLQASCKPEWAKEYVDYVALKRILHAARHLKDLAGEVDKERAEFDAKWASRLSTELQKVNAFFSTQLQHLERLTGMLGAHMQEAELNASVRKQLGRKLGRFLQHQHDLTEYSSLNFMAFFKICKKHDKLLSGTMTESMSWVREEPFFAPGRERLARVKVQLESMADGIPVETIQLSTGLTIGSSVRTKALYFFTGNVFMGTFCIICLACLPTHSEFSHRHMARMVDFWRFFLLFNLLVWLCGVCTAVFERYGINYVFLFGINASTCLPADWYFTLAAGQLLVLLLMMIIFLADFKYTDSCYQEDEIGFQRCDTYPMVVLVASVILPFLPSRHFRRKYRKNLLSCFFSVLIAPIPAVTFAANIMGDVLCSFTRPLKDLEFVGCYTVRLLSGRTFPKSVKCFRRYVTTGEKWPHLANLAKYICSLSVGLVSIKHLMHAGLSETNANLTWGALAVVATVYSFLWDIYMDWGLGLVSARRNLGAGHADAEGNALQAEIYPRSFYRWAIILDLVGRSVWSTNLTIALPYWNFGYYKTTVETVLSMVELLRRGIWMLLRVELEHLRMSTRFPTLCYVPPVRTIRAQARLSISANWAPSVSPSPPTANATNGHGSGNTVRFAGSPPPCQPLVDNSASEEGVGITLSGISESALRASQESARTWHAQGVVDRERVWGRGITGSRPPQEHRTEICMVPLAAAASY